MSKKGIVDKVILMDPGFYAEIPYIGNNQENQTKVITRDDYKVMVKDLTTNGIPVTIVGSKGSDYSDFGDVGATLKTYSGEHLDLNSDASYFGENLW